MINKNEAFWKRKEVCAYLRVSSPTLLRMERKGLLSRHYISGSIIRYKASEVISMTESSKYKLGSGVPFHSRKNDSTYIAPLIRDNLTAQKVNKPIKGQDLETEFLNTNNKKRHNEN